MSSNSKNWIPKCYESYISSVVRKLREDYFNEVLLPNESITVFKNTQSLLEQWLADKNNANSMWYKSLERNLQETKIIKSLFSKFVVEDFSKLSIYSLLNDINLMYTYHSRMREDMIHGVISRDEYDIFFPPIPNHIVHKVRKLIILYSQKNFLSFMSTLCDCVLEMKMYIQQRKAFVAKLNTLPNTHT